MVYTAALLFGHGLSVLSEDKSVQHMRGKSFCGPSVDRQTKSARRGSVESCEESYSSPGADMDVIQSLTQEVERCLTEAKTSTLHCQVLLLPRRMTSRVGLDVVQASADEPCGLRGASIQIYIESKDGLKSVGSVFPDATVTPTFELSMIFKADNDNIWPPLRHLFNTSRVLKLKPEYRLVKRKLYSSASPVIHDFS
ncbi:DNA damage-inducible transcript 4-like protein [Gouania willdenowi]|uniref:DNA damage-inducible transcript 4-like protein n=1 Tax=Gouania willdenowi TaxID=441366 RepID=A0A8C5I3B1_GOUWI|nr:DNA damage-inducible transcript 4-like protein [Gouania willdenowi]